MCEDLHKTGRFPSPLNLLKVEIRPFVINREWITTGRHVERTAATRNYGFLYGATSPPGNKNVRVNSGVNITEGIRQQPPSLRYRPTPNRKLITHFESISRSWFMVRTCWSCLAFISHLFRRKGLRKGRTPYGGREKHRASGTDRRHTIIR